MQARGCGSRSEGEGVQRVRRWVTEWPAGGVSCPELVAEAVSVGGRRTTRSSALAPVFGERRRDSTAAAAISRASARVSAIAAYMRYAADI